MSLFQDIYDLFFTVGGGAKVLTVQSTIPAPSNTQDSPVTIKASCPAAQKVDIILKTLFDFTPVVMVRKKIQTIPYAQLNSDVGSIWKKILDPQQAGRDERVKHLFPYIMSYCETQYNMMGSGNNKLSVESYTLFQNVQRTVSGFRMMTTGTLYITLDKYSRASYIAINPLFVLRTVLETFLKQAHFRKISNDAAGLEIIAKQTVCFLFMHEVSYRAYGHMNGISTYDELFGKIKSNYTFDSYINKKLETDEGWVTPDNAVTASTYVLTEAVTVDDTFSLSLQSVYTAKNLFKLRTERAVFSNLPDSFIGYTPVCPEDPDTPSMRWEVKKNIILLMDEKGVFNPNEKNELIEKLNKDFLTPIKQEGLDREQRKNSGDELQDVLNSGGSEGRLREIPRTFFSAADDVSNLVTDIQHASVEDQLSMNGNEISDMMVNLIKNAPQSVKDAVARANFDSDIVIKNRSIPEDNSGVRITTIPTDSKFYTGNAYRKFARFCIEQRETYVSDAPSRKVIGLLGRYVDVESNKKNKVLFIVDLSVPIDKNIIAAGIATTMIELLKINRTFKNDIIAIADKPLLIPNLGTKREGILAALDTVSVAFESGTNVMVLNDILSKIYKGYKAVVFISNWQFSDESQPFILLYKRLFRNIPKLMLGLGTHPVDIEADYVKFFYINDHKTVLAPLLAKDFNTKDLTM
jgi:hypothetical protein